MRSIKVILAIVATVALLVGYLRSSNPSSAKLRPENLNVVLIVVDTLPNKQFVAKSMHGKPVAPFLNSLKENSVSFERAYTSAPWTKPSIGSIMTGYLPSVHGMRDAKTKISADITTLAESLKARGYNTAGFTSHIFLSPKTSFARGFETYELAPFDKNVHDSITANKVSDLALDWLGEAAGPESTRNFFLFLHYFDPHFNYMHHEEFDQSAWYKGTLFPGISFRKLRELLPSLTKEDARYLEGLHREEIGFTDSQISRVINKIRQSSRSEDTLIIFAADHGEEFLEHNNIGHGRSMYDEVIQVPLFFHLPKHFPPRKIVEPVSTMDVTPTVMSIVDSVGSPQNYNGKSLQSILEGKTLGSGYPRDLITEVDYHESLLSVVRGKFKLILNKTDRRFEFYNLASDPGELKNMSEIGDHEVEKELKKVLADFEANVQGKAKGPKPDAAPPPDALPKEVEQLKSLGYL